LSESRLRENLPPGDVKHAIEQRMASHGFWWRKERALKIFTARKNSNG
jgi:hypothetical protein